jgi:cysteine desulfurase
MTDRIYLDHAATTPLLPQARAAMLEGFARWANPSSPHAAGRAARALLEDARGRIARALGWQGSVILTSGASEAISLALGQARARVFAGASEHDAVLRLVPEGGRLAVDTGGQVILPDEIETGSLIAIQHVNSETGVIQPLDAFAERIHRAGARLFADCSQSAGKLPLPQSADLIAISAHKLGGPIGIGALLVRDLTMLQPGGGQEQGYRAGTEAMPLALGFAAALEAPREWLGNVAIWRARLEAGIKAAGGEIVAENSPRLSTIGSYRMPGVSAQAQLIRFDIAGIAISAGSACSSGSLRPSHVLSAMGWEARATSEVVRVTMGHDSRGEDIDAFLAQWQAVATGTQKT